MTEMLQSHRSPVADGGAKLPQERPKQDWGAGLFPSQSIRELVRTGQIASDAPIVDAQIQPASLDLRLSDVAYRVRASFLPRSGMTVARRLEQMAAEPVSLSAANVLESGRVYIIPVQERFALADRISAVTNPKSSTGRLDVFTRIICDFGAEFDRVPSGYNGPLYAEVSPRTFPVKVRKGSRLNQVRFRVEGNVLSDADLLRLHQRDALTDRDPIIDHGLKISVDLRGDASHGIIGYRAQRFTDSIDIDSVGRYELTDYWEPIYSRRSGELVLDPGQFYILSSSESVRVPGNYAAEMVPFDPLFGDFRAHYAGFFDPGFGTPPAKAVLEVRSFEVPFILEHGQTIGRLVYEGLSAAPERLYGGDIGSNYQAQRLRLSKHFRPL